LTPDQKRLVSFPRAGAPREAAPKADAPTPLSQIQLALRRGRQLDGAAPARNQAGEGAIEPADCEISVTPAAGGWAVHAGLLDAPLMFLSGAKAEEKARALAEHIAATGRDAKVLVHDRSQALVGTWRYFAHEAADGAAEPGGERPVLRSSVPSDRIVL
jgi:hypothetical protein